MTIYILAVLKYLFLFAGFALLGFIGFIMMSFRDKVPFVPTPKRIIRKMIDMADIQPNEKICDLGSGTGRIIILVAQKNRQNLVIGVEKSLTLRIISNFFLFWHPFLKKNIQIIKKDFFNMDFHEFDVIFCFSTPEALRILAPKFQLLKPGSRIISYMFPLENQDNFLEVSEHISDKDSVYYYKKIS